MEKTSAFGEENKQHSSGQWRRAHLCCYHDAIYELGFLSIVFASFRAYRERMVEAHALEHKNRKHWTKRKYIFDTKKYFLSGSDTCHTTLNVYLKNK